MPVPWGPPAAARLELQMEGADDDTLRRGLEAAAAVLNAHGVSAADADHGRWRREASEALGLADDRAVFSVRDSRAALAWDEAVQAARMATGEGHDTVGAGWRLVVVVAVAHPHDAVDDGVSKSGLPHRRVAVPGR
ncbi:hypothetical protein AACH06_21955 [Ideonella sp. DXS29W]|uniref:Uncharacterized protein n=1 Tax=Ideonella lacteola TaxID=2984193 RepID=A0ABU9BWJ7_9BURK